MKFFLALVLTCLLVNTIHAQNRIAIFLKDSDQAFTYVDPPVPSETLLVGNKLYVFVPSYDYTEKAWLPRIVSEITIGQSMRLVVTADNPKINVTSKDGAKYWERSLGNFIAKIDMEGEKMLFTSRETIDEETEDLEKKNLSINIAHPKQFVVTLAKDGSYQFSIAGVYPGSKVEHELRKVSKELSVTVLGAMAKIPNTSRAVKAIEGLRVPKGKKDTLEKKLTELGYSFSNQ